MKAITALLIYLICPISWALTLSPEGREVSFQYKAMFVTSEEGGSQELALKHAQFLFGYLQSPELVRRFGIYKDTPGIGAPTWPLEINIIERTKHGDKKAITYEAKGTLLLNRMVTDQILPNGNWELNLPYDLDNYFDEKCSHWEAEIVPGNFWYYYDPYFKGCEKLNAEPFARSTPVRIQEIAEASSDQSTSLAELRGPNGNGEIFEIVTINGFDEKANPKDNGAKAFASINEYFENSGFKKTYLQNYEDRPIVRFEKTLQTSQGKDVLVRVTRLLAKTDLSLRNVTFAKFFKNAIENADVVVFAGHSGADVVLDISDIEDKAGPVRFNFEKHQLFFFDACSGYSYYLPMFKDNKAPGTLAVLSFGLPSQFGFESSMHQILFDALLDFNSDDINWLDLMTNMEKPLKGMTFLLNLWTP